MQPLNSQVNAGGTATDEPARLARKSIGIPIAHSTVVHAIAVALCLLLSEHPTSVTPVRSLYHTTYHLQYRESMVTPRCP